MQRVPANTPKFFVNLLALSLLSMSPMALADQVSPAQTAATHAPIGVMGDHVHARDEVMFSYRYMFMHMDGMRDGQDDLSPIAVLDPSGAYGFMVTPLEMSMQMHMMGAMWAPSNDLTLMLMGSYRKLEMDHRTRMGREFTTATTGWGDTKLSALYRLWQQDAWQVLLNAGLSLPTGSIDARDDTPAMANAILPYPMQLGSGTYDITLGTTVNFQPQGTISGGAQALYTHRLDDNDRGYALGNRFEATLWGAYCWTPALSTSARLRWQTVGGIDGADAALNPMMVPTADTDLHNRDQLDLLLGTNWMFHDGTLEGHRLAIEAGAPLYEKLDGPQMSVDWTLTVGWQKVW